MCDSEQYDESKLNDDCDVSDMFPSNCGIFEQVNDISKLWFDE